MDRLRPYRLIERPNFMAAHHMKSTKIRGLDSAELIWCAEVILDPGVRTIWVELEIGSNFDMREFNAV